MNQYESFLKSKLIRSVPAGFDVSADELNTGLYPFQNDLCRWGLKRGKAALFSMTGTGKTPMQSVWGDAVSQYDGHGAVLMLAPLAVSKQTAKQMGEKFNIDIRPCRDRKDIGPGLNITNYEMMHHFSPDGLAGIVLDESSIIKAFNGKTRTQIIDFSRDIPFRLACTATPSPNDYMELGNHAEFLGIMSYTEMLATFFIHDGGDTSKWRLKGHAEKAFWEWLASWGVFLTKPSDLGYSDEGFDLPPLNTFQHVVESGATEGALFAFEARGLQERQAARRESLQARVNKCAEIVFSSLIGSFCAKLAEKTGGNHGLEQKICGEPEGERGIRPRVQVETDDSRDCKRPGEAQGIHEGVCCSESGKVQADTGTAAESKCSQKGEICPGCSIPGIAENNGKAISGKQPSHQESAENQEIQSDGIAISVDDGCTEREMCNMWLQRHYENKLLSCGGSLPCFKGCPRAALHELQHGAGKIQRLARTLIESGRVLEEQWVVWCDLNIEQETLAKIFGPLCVSVTGSDSTEKKEDLLDIWLDKKVPILISKPSIFGFGLNLQQCHNTVFVGLSDSFEAVFQATKRFHRHGQLSPVNRHLVISQAEGSVLSNIQRKEREFETMIANMVEHTKKISMENIKSLKAEKIEYMPTQDIQFPEWLKEGGY